MKNYSEKQTVRNPETIGEHLRKKRLESNLFQKDVAEIIGVSEDTITFWEKGRVQPKSQQMPLIIEFLGYNPIPIGNSCLPGKIHCYRILKGLSKRAFGRLLKVDASTICSWENGALPSKKNLCLLNEILKDLKLGNIQ